MTQKDANVADGFEHQTYPLIREITGAEAVDVFHRWAALPHCLFLDSASRSHELGRYSFVMADPIAFCTIRRHDKSALEPAERAGPWSVNWSTDWTSIDGSPPGVPCSDEADCPWELLSSLLAGIRGFARPGLPPFQGGWAGLFGYELLHSLERIPEPAYDEFRTPALAVGLYDVVAAFDHLSARGWIFSRGWSADGGQPCYERAEKRLADFLERLQHAPETPARLHYDGGGALTTAELAPRFATDYHSEVTSDFSADGYRRAVRRAIEYIHAGDLFQVNLSQRLLTPASENPLELYLRLRKCNPSPFAAYFDTGPFHVLSASPERFLSVRDRCVETRPIKGTRPRTRMPEADLFSADELLQSPKDRAENVMIVDLLRNDLSRVCDPDSVQVPDLCRLESFQFVQHLVSIVRGRLAEGQTVVDLMKAAFPGGSITGAPKVRAMEIISEIEPTARGPYCGALAYLGCDGTFDSSILIRTITAGRGWWQLPVGGGIVADSDAQQEFEETWHKATGLLRALRQPK